jgi:hypothetical protein
VIPLPPPCHPSQGWKTQFPTVYSQWHNFTIFYIKKPKKIQLNFLCGIMAISEQHVVNSCANKAFLEQVLYKQDLLQLGNYIWDFESTAEIVRLTYWPMNEIYKWIRPLSKICFSKFKICKSVHHYTIQINQPTRCNKFSSLLLDVYLQLNTFRAFSRPSSGAQQLQ